MTKEDSAQGNASELSPLEHDLMQIELRCIINMLRCIIKMHQLGTLIRHTDLL